MILASSLDKQGPATYKNAHLMVEPGWGDLDVKERRFCTDANMKPDDYLAIKKQLLVENMRTKAVTEALIKEKGRDIKGIKEKAPLIFDFFVQSKLINQK